MALLNSCHVLLYYSTMFGWWIFSLSLSTVLPWLDSFWGSLSLLFWICVTYDPFILKRNCLLIALLQCSFQFLHITTLLPRLHYFKKNLFVLLWICVTWPFLFCEGFFYIALLQSYFRFGTSLHFYHIRPTFKKACLCCSGFVWHDPFF